MNTLNPTPDRLRRLLRRLEPSSPDGWPGIALALVSAAFVAMAFAGWLPGAGV